MTFLCPLFSALCSMLNTRFVRYCHMTTGLMMFKPIVYTIFLLFVCSWENAEGRTYTNTISIWNGGIWGEWTEPEFCPDGMYAYGYDMKIEPKQGSYRDDSSLNAIKLLCRSPNGDCTTDVSSGRSPWGDWVGETVCNGSDVLVGFSLQVEGDQGQYSDDSAANFIKFKCRSASGLYEIAKEPGTGFWGIYYHSVVCDNVICGIRTRLEEPQNGGDDSALNDVIFYCCD